MIQFIVINVTFIDQTINMLQVNINYGLVISEKYENG